MMAAKATIPNNPVPCGAVPSTAALPSSFSGSPLQKVAFLKVRDGGSSRVLGPVRAADSLPAKRVVQSYASYAVPIENQATASITSRPLAEIFRDMNKRVPDKVLKIQLDEGVPLKYIPWYDISTSSSIAFRGWASICSLASGLNSVSEQTPLFPLGGLDPYPHCMC